MSGRRAGARRGENRSDTLNCHGITCQYGLWTACKGQSSGLISKARFGTQSCVIERQHQTKDALDAAA